MSPGQLRISARLKAAEDFIVFCNMKMPRPMTAPGINMKSGRNGPVAKPTKRKTPNTGRHMTTKKIRKPTITLCDFSSSSTDGTNVRKFSYSACASSATKRWSAVAGPALCSLGNCVPQYVQNCVLSDVILASQFGQWLGASVTPAAYADATLEFTSLWTEGHLETTRQVELRSAISRVAEAELEFLC